MSFSKRLKTAMAEREMSQAELAAHIGKGKSSVSQYLSGKNIPKDDVQQKIAEVLDCSVEYLNEEVPENDNSELGLRKISVDVAAKRLGVCPQSVRVSLQQGTAPYGYAWKAKSKYQYHISPKKLDEYIGKDTDENISNE